MIERESIINDNRYRSIIIISVTSLSLLLTVIFHIFLEMGIIFTHFFYIPIILSSLWWGRKGLIVTVILAAALLSTDVYSNNMTLLFEDALRAVVLLSISWITVFLNERYLLAKRQLENINRELESLVEGRTLELKQVNTDLAEELRHRRITEAVLEEERNKLKITMRSIADGVIVTDHDGRITMMNAVTEFILDVRNDDCIGKRIDDIFVPLDIRTGEPMENPALEALRSGQPTNLPDFAIIYRSDGTKVRLADSAAPVYLNDQLIGAVVVFTDVTEKEMLKEELFAAQKLKSLELLAAGVAHDFNNILTVVAGNLHLMEMNPKDEEKCREHIHKALTGIEKAGSLTKNLMHFSKVGTPSKSAGDISETIREGVLFSLSGSQIDLDMEIQTGLYHAYIDQVHLGQILGNLVKNAREAMMDKGTLKVRAYNETSGPFDGYRPGDYVVITIEDNGPGIGKDIINNIFEPYVSNKKNGSGLGLALTNFIIKRHNGYIEVSGREGEGAIFTIHLPALRQNVGDHDE